MVDGDQLSRRLSSGAGHGLDWELGRGTPAVTLAGKGQEALCGQAARGQMGQALHKGKGQ